MISSKIKQQTALDGEKIVREKRAVFGDFEMSCD
jgi:hypothetical protein